MTSKKKRIDDFDKYKVDDEKCIELYYQLRYKEANECFEKNDKDKIMIFTGPRSPFHRGAVLLELERYQDAIDWFDQALKFEKSEEILKVLYPDGIEPKQYKDMLAVTRIIDKLFRIATQKEAFGESPFKDIAGYGILGVANDEEKTTGR